MNLGNFTKLSSSGSEDYESYTGPATMAEISELLIENIYDIYVISAVLFSYKTSMAKSVKINAGTQIDKDKFTIFKDHFSGLNILIIPRGMQVDLKSMVMEATNTLAQKKEAVKESVKKEIMVLRDNAVKAYMLCLKICRDLYGVVPQGTGGRTVDEELGKKFLSLGKALDALYLAALHVAKQLSNDTTHER